MLKILIDRPFRCVRYTGWMGHAICLLTVRPGARVKAPLAGGPGDQEGQLAAAFAAVVARYPPQVAETIASLHRPVRDEDGLADLLERAATTAVQWIPDVDWAGVTIKVGGPAFTAASTDPRVLAVDTAQYALKDGPCLLAMRDRSIVAFSPAEVTRSWPRLAATARSQGVLSFLSAPLLDAGVPRGSMNLYSGGDSGFADFEVDFLQVLSAYVSRGLGDFAAARDAAEQNQQLHEAMASRAPIEQAKGILMAVHQISSDAAFELLRTQSQHTNVKLRDVAAHFVATQARQPVFDSRNTRDTLTDFHTAFDHSPVGIALTDLTGHVLLANPALVALVPDAGEDSSSASVLDHVHPDDAVATTAALADLVESPDELVRVPVRMLDEHGATVHTLLAASLVQTSAAEADQLVVTLDDVDALVRQPVFQVDTQNAADEAPTSGPVPVPATAEDENEKPATSPIGQVP
jgi:PAS domain S-box-containing protein